jgi:hypothetical protein
MGCSIDWRNKQMQVTIDALVNNWWMVEITIKPEPIPELDRKVLDAVLEDMGDDEIDDEGGSEITVVGTNYSYRWAATLQDDGFYIKEWSQYPVIEAE